MEFRAGEKDALQSWMMQDPIPTDPDPSKATLTCLTRLAQRPGPTRRWLASVFDHRLEQLAEPAVEVAVETGDPIGTCQLVESSVLPARWVC